MAAVSVVCTVGEIIYAGRATALVTALALPHLLGRTLARFELSTGFGLAVPPAAITALAPHGPAALWGTLATATLLSASAVAPAKAPLRPRAACPGVCSRHRSRADPTPAGPGPRVTPA
ncbi:hypothetical protein ADK52_37625 [Streptomyces sp. WM6372]|nr:hypothetical protein ADK52_37625 [Streptomyces sp. WM6372]